MATILQTKPYTPIRPWTPAWLGRQALLVPEMVGLPLLFGAYLLAGESVALAFIGELLIALFFARITLLWLAGRALDGGRYRRAGALARWAGRLHPWSADVAALRGAILLAQGQAAAADEAFQRADSLFPGHASFLVCLSMAWTEQGQINEARAAASQAVALDDSCAGAYAQLALLALKQGNRRSAADYAHQGLLIAFAPSSMASLYLIQAEVALGDENPRAAQAAVDQVTALLIECPVPAQAEVLYRLGLLRRQLGEAEAAINDFTRIEQIDPEGRFVGLAWRSRHEAALAA